jgi:hypothetical protein
VELNPMTEKKSSKRTSSASGPKAIGVRTRKVSSENGSGAPIALAEVVVRQGEALTRLISDQEIAVRAYALWEDRGRPLGSPDVDWYNAKNQLCC